MQQSGFGKHRRVEVCRELKERYEREVHVLNLIMTYYKTSEAYKLTTAQETSNYACW